MCAQGMFMKVKNFLRVPFGGTRSVLGVLAVQ
jgi:hypothetical protein